MMIVEDNYATTRRRVYDASLLYMVIYSHRAMEAGKHIVSEKVRHSAPRFPGFESRLTGTL